MREPVPCKSCKAPMLWIESEKGKMVPLDAEPVPDGNIVIRDGKAHFLTKEEVNGQLFVEDRYKSHFATCPDAQKYRKKT